MTKQEILDKVNKVNGLGGMTVNERLYVTGLMDTFDKAKKKDKELARFILGTIRVDKPSIDKNLNSMGLDMRPMGKPKPRFEERFNEIF